jgi:outer membrane protein assembly factor BamB
VKAFSQVTLSFLLFSSTLPAGAAEPWPQFLGPQRNGISAETGLNLDWKTKKPKTLWTIPLGAGWSSMSFGEGRLFTITRRGQRDVVVCLDPLTGKEKWARDGAPTYIEGQRQGPGPRATPTYHDGKVYCLFPMGDLFCLKGSDGSVVWKVNIFEATGASNHAKEYYYWGMSGSPLIEGDLVIVQPGGSKGNSVAAFHRNTGKKLWSAADDPPGYSSPIALTAQGRRQIVCFTGKAALAVDPAGKVLWRYPLFNEFDTNCATPVWSDNILLIASAYGPGCAALEIVASDQSVAVRPRWTTKKFQNQMATSIILDGHIYGCHGDLGACMVRCLELKTGKEKWSARKPGKCSLIAAEGHLICLSEDGTLRLIEASPKGYNLKGELPDVLEYKAWTPPALWNKKLYVRDMDNLVCLDVAR